MYVYTNMIGTDHFNDSSLFLFLLQNTSVYFKFMKDVFVKYIHSSFNFCIVSGVQVPSFLFNE